MKHDELDRVSQEKLLEEEEGLAAKEKEVQPQ